MKAIIKFLVIGLEVLLLHAWMLSLQTSSICFLLWYAFFRYFSNFERRIAFSIDERNKKFPKRFFFLTKSISWIENIQILLCKSWMEKNAQKAYKIKHEVYGKRKCVEQKKSHKSHQIDFLFTFQRFYWLLEGVLSTFYHAKGSGNLIRSTNPQLLIFFDLRIKHAQVIIFKRQTNLNRKNVTHL